MLLIVNKDMREPAKEKLLASVRIHHPDAELLELETEGIVHTPLPGFPCMFFCPIPGKLVVSPDLPEKYLTVLGQHKIQFVEGSSEVAKKRSSEKPETRNPKHETYSALVTPEYLIHNLRLTDPVILQNCHYLKKIAVKQGFTRSHLIHLKDNHFIASDKGIAEALREKGLDVLEISAREIILPGHVNGGIGGAAGILGDTVFFNGSLSFHPEGEKISNYLERLNYRILELDKAPLMDSGGILFI